jgi:hypothetical protein
VRDRAQRVGAAAEVEAAIKMAAQFLTDARAKDGWCTRDWSDAIAPEYLTQEVFEASYDELWDRARRGDREADTILRNRIWLDLARCGPTDEIKLWLQRLLFVDRPPPDETANQGRDEWITTAVSKVVGLGFNPTRSRANKKVESACSIVTKALTRVGIHKTESAINEIWRLHH